ASAAAVRRSRGRVSRYNRRHMSHTAIRMMALAAVGLAAACGRQTHAAADLVVVHAKVWTGDRSRPAADGVAVVADRIVDGGGADQIDRWRGPDTRVVDAAGRRVVPGFNDRHVHFVDGGRQLDNVHLKDA